MTREPARDAFLLLRDRLVIVFKKYCRYLKDAKEEDKKTLPKYLKQAKQLTILVSLLNPANLEQNEDEVPLDSLDKIDTTADSQFV